MNRYAMIQDGIVINVIIWDGVSPWQAPEGVQVVQSDTLNTGDSYSPEQ